MNKNIKDFIGVFNDLDLKKLIKICIDKVNKTETFCFIFNRFITEKNNIGHYIAIYVDFENYNICYFDSLTLLPD